LVLGLAVANLELDRLVDEDIAQRPEIGRVRLGAETVGAVVVQLATCNVQNALKKLLALRLESRVVIKLEVAPP
jgi:hypothetical protein